LLKKYHNNSEFDIVFFSRETFGDMQLK